MARNEDLQDCPFCGADERDVSFTVNWDRTEQWVECDLCGSQTKHFPYSDDSTAQRDAWNRRGSPASGGTDGG